MKENVLRENATCLFTAENYDDCFYLAQKLYALQYDTISSLFKYTYEYEDDDNADIIYLFNTLQNSGFEHINSSETKEKNTETVEIISLSNNPLCRYGDNHHFFSHKEKQIYVFWEIHSILCVYNLRNPESKKWCEDFLSQFNTFCNEHKQKKSKIQCIGFDERIYFLKEMEIKPIVDMNINSLYNEDFLPVDKNIRSFMENDRNGLVILHGEQGTGKTSYIRHLISVTNKNFVYLPLDMASCLSDPRMVTFLCNKMKDAVVIIEDCEQLLVDRSTTGGYINTGLVNILNMADGLIGDSLNLKFICTFNSDIQKIDKALLRKGRLVEKYEFGKLSKEKTSALMQKLYAVSGDFVPMTLAEMYNYNTENHGENKQRKTIGF